MSYVSLRQEYRNKNCILWDVITCPVYAMRAGTHGKNNFLSGNKFIYLPSSTLFILLMNLSHSYAVYRLSAGSRRGDA